jgi:hypothetical protein
MEEVTLFPEKSLLNLTNESSNMSSSPSDDDSMFDCSADQVLLTKSPNMKNLNNGQVWDFENWPALDNQLTLHRCFMRVHFFPFHFFGKFICLIRQ